MTKRSLRNVSEEDLKTVDEVRRHRLRYSRSTPAIPEESGCASRPIVISPGPGDEDPAAAAKASNQTTDDEEDESSETESETSSFRHRVHDPPRQWRRTQLARRETSQVARKVYTASFEFVRTRQR